MKWGSDPSIHNESQCCYILPLQSQHLWSRGRRIAETCWRTAWLQFSEKLCLEVGKRVMEQDR